MVVSGAVKAGAVLGAIVVVAVLAVSVVTLVKVFDLKNDNTVIISTVAPVSTVGKNVYTPSPLNSQKYQEAANYFAKSVDTSVNPCDDFYQYACGKYNDSLSFDVADNANYQQMADAFNSASGSDSFSVKQVKTMFAQCVAANKNWGSIVGNGQIIRDTVNAFKQNTNFNFPLFDNSNDPWPSASALGTALGYLSGYMGIDTLVTPFVDTNWKDPAGSQSYLLYIDQSTLTLPWTYYVGKTWSITKPALSDAIRTVFGNYSTTQNLPLNTNALNADIEAILNFEYMIANNYSTDDVTRWQQSRMYNLFNSTKFTAMYPKIDINAYLKQLTHFSPDATNLVAKADFTFGLAEPQRLTELNIAFLTGFNNAVTPRTFYNYLYFRLMYANRNYFPSTALTDEFLEKYRLHRPIRGRPKFVPNPKLKHMLSKDVDPITLGCVDDTVFSLPYANARVFIDKIYPTAESRTKIRQSVRKVVDGILIGMQSMLDQLSWMTSASKLGAYQKIQNLIRNVAYPDFITNNTLLDAYHSKLQDFSNQNYYQISNLIRAFSMRTSFDLLLRTDGVTRTDWNGSPGTVNAWYQPELNSITFPAAILRQPYFDPEWPSSVNFGSMGVIAGHELTHAFDSSGTQWDGTGQLYGWMDNVSQISFNNMTNCVANEYSKFCPLDQQSYAPNCINGQQTVGENVADNGGIHSAYRAYRNAINYAGSEPLLPGDLISQFTHDQLFFLSFAQVWCQAPPSPSSLYRQILVDPHSPSKYRVFGTIKNYPGFKNAFHCPTGATYSPTDHCNIWISDVNVTNSSSGSVDLLNVPKPDIVKEDKVQFVKYSEAQQYFQYSLNLTADPCNDFYNYACGSYQQPLSFTVYRNRNYDTMAQQLETISQPGYNGNMASSTAIKKTVMFYNQCKTARNNLNALIKDGQVVKSVLDEFSTYTGLAFNWFDNSAANKPDSKTLAKALAFLSVKYGVNTLVTPLQDTNPRNDSRFKGYVLYIDQNSAFYSKSYYQPGAWTKTLPAYTSNAVALFKNYGDSIKANYNIHDVAKSIDAVIDFEHTLATTYSTDDITRRTFLRSWNPTTVSAITAKFLDWNTYVSEIASLSGVNFVDSSTVANYYVSLFEPTQITNMDTFLNTVNGDTIVKYLYFRLLLSQQEFVYVGNSTSKYVRVYPREETSHEIGRRFPRKDPFESAETDFTPRQCAYETLANLQYANARVFTEVLYPTQDSRTKIKTDTTKVITAIKNAMQSMLDDLTWLDATSRLGARSKVENLVINIAYPDFILDNAALDNYHNALNFANTDNYFAMLRKLTVFNQYQNFIYLTRNTVDRHDFLGPPGTVNAWYQPELNSITIPEGILQQPYYDTDWPASVKFGALGVIVGHELGHAFDDQGVQWDGFGQLNLWMTNTSYQSFTDMAKCVVDEYSNFQPLNASVYSPSHLNGANTQGENIADNGGIHSGYRSYRKWIALNGPDPQLPDRILSQFNHDQLFFLSFSQVWCQMPPTPDEIYKQILVDVHSPSKYRVLGTIQNFPAFRTAFNCPVNSVYAPLKHCYVWVPSS
uniref:Uncharacterized protein n=1 Tax=Panagrolaimus sp. JU765 TaxID=591449 RepID=A0AC34Q1X1_9BILA